MSNTSHALLSASSSNRWLHCSPSARLSEDFSSTTSEYASEGTKAHYGAEKWLKMDFRKSSDTYKTLNEFFKEKDYPPDMIDYIGGYVDYVKGIAQLDEDSEVEIELTVDLSNFIPSGFGTVDCAVLSPKNHMLHIIDFKYGRGVQVSAEKNTQMMIYALGVLQKMQAFDTELVQLTIYQPRIHNISEWVVEVKKLLAWGKKVLIPKAQVAWEGKGETNAGEWCRFCPVKPRCRRYSEYIMKTPSELPVEFTKLCQLVSDDELADILDRGKELATYIKAVEDELRKAIKEKGAIKGYTLQEVKGKRILNPACIDVLKSFDVSVYEQKLKSLSTLEKEYGKKFIEEAIADDVTYSEPTYRLVRTKEVFKDVVS